MGSAKKDVTHAGKAFACVTFFKYQRFSLLT